MYLCTKANLDAWFVPSVWEVCTCMMSSIVIETLQWRHNGCDGVSNHQPHKCLLNLSFCWWSKKTSNLRVTGLCAWNSPVNSSHKGPVTRKMFPFDDVIMNWSFANCAHHYVITPTPNMKSAVSISDHIKQLLLKSYFRTYHSPCAILKYVTYNHSIMNTCIILSGHYSKLKWTITQIGK